MRTRRHKKVLPEGNHFLFNRPTFIEWAKAVPAVGKGDVSGNITITLPVGSWAMLLAVCARRGASIEEIASEALHTEIINGFNDV